MSPEVQGRAIIIGAGPAGLTAAYELLTRTGIKPIVLEKSDQNGGAAQARIQNGSSGSGESESRLIARINQLTQQLEMEKQKNRTLKGA